METIRVVLDSKLRWATDRVARRIGQNRSALIRDAIRSHLRRLEILEMQKRDQKGCAAISSGDAEAAGWLAAAAWPED